MSMSNTIDNQTNWLTQISIVVGLIVFTPYALLATSSMLFPSIYSLLSSVFGTWLFLAAATLLAHSLSYWLICLGLLGVSIVSLTRGQPTKKQTFFVLVVILMVLFFMFAPYRTAVSAQNGYSMIVTTEPGLISRGLKNAQAIGEVTPCTYKILGWNQNSVLYESNCQSGQNQLWQFSPEKMNIPVELLGKLPSPLYAKKATREATLANIMATNVYPLEAEPSVRRLYVPEDGYLSPDGKWLAIVSRYLYGAEDVILVKTTNE